MKHESAYATKSDFLKARLGYPFMECCGICGEETNSIILKKKGDPHQEQRLDLIPRFLLNPEANCEFCAFVGAFMQSEGIESCGEGKIANVQWGAAKIVSRDKKTGVDTLIAFLPFNTMERTIPIKPNGAETKEEDVHIVKLHHRMILNGERKIIVGEDGLDAGESLAVTEVLEPGIE